MNILVKAALTTAFFRWNQPECLRCRAGHPEIRARYADSLFLDPVLNDANVDIWTSQSLRHAYLSIR